MKPLLGVFPLLLGLMVLDAPAQTTVQGEPFGYVKINITAGTGTAKRTTLLSVPLLEEASITGNATGRITGVTATTITASGAGWAEGQLSAPATPFLLEITSGTAKGRMLLLSTSAANTSDTVTLDGNEAVRVGDLTALGIAAGLENGDTYRIRPVDTLSSFFGTPDSTLVEGGTNPRSADTIVIVVNGSATTYYFDTARGRWTATSLGNPDASNTPIPPYAGVQYARIAKTPLEFIVTGKVPSGERAVSVKASGTTLLSPFWPVNQTLAALGLQNMTNWAKSASSSAADKVVLTAGGSASTYYHDGTNWRSSTLGTPVADAVTVPVGSSVMVSKRGGTSGYTVYQHAAPYDLQ